MTRARSLTSNTGIRYPSEARSAIITDALESIRQGIPRHEIAVRHGISPRTLDLWLRNTDAGAAHSAYVDDRLVEADNAAQLALANIISINTDEEMDVQRAQLRLARARAIHQAADRERTAAQWYAERRDARYRPQQRVEQDTTVTVVLNLDPRERAIDGTSEPVDKQIDALHNDTGMGITGNVAE